MTWDSEYYTTQDTDHGARAGISQQRRHLDRLVKFSSSDDYSSRHVTTHMVIIVLKAIYRGWV